MNPERLNRIADQQTGIARKVLDAVPIAEEWTTSAVSRELFRVGTRIDKDTLEGCLQSLKESGLVKEPHAGHWRRVHVERAEEPETAPGAKVKFVRVDPLDRMATLTATLRERASQLLMLADEIDAAAIAMEEERAAGSASDQKLRQLQSLLRDIGGAP